LVAVRRLSSHRFVCLAAAEKLEFLFVIRNGKESAENFAFASWTMHSILRGTSGSGRPPELRRDWIGCEACGLEWQVGRRRAYPLEMFRLRGTGRKLSIPPSTAG
jgi:hypothetical protein